MRKFYFTNALGERYLLTDKNFKSFLNTPQGLGFSKSIGTQRLGDSELVTSSYYNMPQPNGEVLFYDKNREYQSYFDFIKFLSYAPIKFHYIPSNAIEPYYIDCEVIQLDKSEISYEDGVMHCPIVIYGTSLWKTSNQQSMTLTNEIVGEGKLYDLVRPYNYAGSSLANIEFNNNGTLPTGFIIEIDGAIQNPQLSAYDVNNNRYGILKLNGTYDYVRVNTNDKEQEIYLENNGSVIANPTSYQDLSVADGQSVLTFFKLRVGQSKLVFTGGNIETFDGTVTFRWNNEFISV